MVEIIQKENKILRGTAKTVPVKEIKSTKIQKIIADMKKALEAEEDGVAIAAPQIGVPLRIFVVSHRTFEIMETPTKNSLEKPEKDQSFSKTKTRDLVFINPEIIKLSKKKEWIDEGCLSVRWFYGQVNRSVNATIQAYNEKGEKFTRGAGGLLAQIFQHEVDHLNGTLFTDKAKYIQEILPENN
jgi:peptide deformylase